MTFIALLKLKPSVNFLNNVPESSHKKKKLFSKFRKDSEKLDKKEKASRKKTKSDTEERKELLRELFKTKVPNTPSYLEATDRFIDSLDEKQLETECIKHGLIVYK